MKYIKYIVGIMVLLVLIYILIGVIKPTLDYENEIIVDKPVAEAWAVTQDEEKMSEWLTGYQKIEHISGTPGTVGAVSDMHFVENGKNTVIRETITEIVPEKSISMTFENDFMDMDYTMTIAPENGNSKINSYTTVEGNGIFAKPMTTIFAGSFKNQEQTNLSKLKSTIENNTKNYFPSVKDSTEINVLQE